MTQMTHPPDNGMTAADVDPEGIAGRVEEMDFATGEGLREVLLALNRDDGRGWRSDPTGAHLLTYAAQKYAPLARTWHRDSADVMYEAFVAMRAPGTAHARDPWAVVTRAVELGVAAEAHAERMLTSADKARRPGLRPAADPVRAGEYQELFYDVLSCADSHDEDRAGRALVRTAAVFLVMTGWPPRTVEAAVSYVCERLGSLSSSDSAMEVLRKDQVMALRLGWSTHAWNGLLRLLLGQPRELEANSLGVIGRILLGARVGELMADQDLVAISRTAAARSRP